MADSVDILMLEMEKKKRRMVPSRWWWFALVASSIVIYFLGNLLGLGWVWTFLALILNIALFFGFGNWSQDIKRPCLFILFPGLAMAILVFTFSYSALGNKALAILAGVLAFALISFLIVTIYTFSLAKLVVSFTGLNFKEARKLLLSQFLYINYPYMIIKDGEVTQTSPEGIFPRAGGPGLAIIHPNSAALFERGDKITKIELGGFVELDRFEHPYKVIDLRPQSASRVVEDVLTKDGVPLKIEIWIFYQIRRHGEPSKENPFPVSHRDVFRAATFVNNWKAATEFVGDYVLRDVVAGLNLEELYEFDQATGQPIPRDRIRTEVRKKLDAIARDWGTEVTWVDIGKIEMPEEAKKRLLDKWLAEREQEIETIRAETERIKIVTQAEGEKVSIVKQGEGTALALERVEEVKKQVREEIVNHFIGTLSKVTGSIKDPKVLERYMIFIENLSQELVKDDIAAIQRIEWMEEILKESSLQAPWLPRLRAPDSSEKPPEI